MKSHAIMVGLNLKATRTLCFSWVMHCLNFLEKGLQIRPLCEGHTQPLLQSLDKQKKAPQSVKRQRTKVSDRHASTLL
jgi:hypothetical protein